VAVDTRTVTDGEAPHRVIQPVEPAAGWDMPAGPPSMPAAAPAGAMEMAMPPAAFGSQLRASGPARPLAAGARMLRRKQSPRQFRWPVEMFTVEAARMRSAAGAPERERRQLLADLASRLDAMLRDRHLTADDRLAGLRRLLGEVRGEVAMRVPADELDRLWQRMQELLDQLTGSTPAAQATPGRPDFWKRT
jgi:Ca-activated chloride channel family protein